MSSADASTSRGSSETAAAAGSSAVPVPTVDSLFPLSRGPNQIALLCLYLPLGIIVAILRFFICLHAFLVTLMLPKTSVIRCYILRVMCTVLGLVVVDEDKNKDREVRVLVANHISVIDHWLLDMLQPCVLPSVWDIPCVLNWGHIYKMFGSPTQPQVSGVKQFLESEPQVSVLSFPEMTITNGIAVMKFSQLWAFELDVPIQAIAIKASRTSPFKELAISTLESSWFSDLMWLLFCPWTTFRVSRLPAVSRRDETVEEFASRVQEMLAAQLGVRATRYTHTEKQDLVKRMQLERLQVQRRAQEAHQRNNQYLVHMAAQVKEVLPDVPMPVILQDLQETNNVDSTISRIVDGVVRYVPEKATTSRTKTETSNSAVPIQELLKSAKDAKVSFNTSATSFGSTAQERFASYQERKVRLIENARLRYIQKQGLKV